jgi:hypothetical protein
VSVGSDPAAQRDRQRARTGQRVDPVAAAIEDEGGADGQERIITEVDLTPLRSAGGQLTAPVATLLRSRSSCR